MNITSISGLRASALRIAYGTSKAALEHLTKQLALELSVRGIRVNAVAPGPVDTAMAKAVHSPAIRADYHDAIPLGRYGLEEEIAEAVFFLASERASYITGQVLAVDGGFDAIGIGLPTFRKEQGGDMMRRRQFTTAPESLMIGAHLASSALMKSAVSFGPRPSTGSTPASCSRLNTFGSSSATLIARGELLDDRRRRAGRRQDRVPGVALEALEPLLLQGRQIGQHAHALRHAGAERDDRAGLRSAAARSASHRTPSRSGRRPDRPSSAPSPDTARAGSAVRPRAI